MKQHLTIEQLNELSEKGREKLREWWKPQVGDMTIYNEGDGYNYEQWEKGGPITEINENDDIRYAAIGTIEYPSDSREDVSKMLPLLSIGQMIEFLDEEYSKGDKFSLSIERSDTGWILWESGDDAKELCDALWDACKEILEK